MHTASGELVLDQRTAVASLPNKEFGIQVIVSGGRALKVAADNEVDCGSWKKYLGNAIAAASDTYSVGVWHCSVWYCEPRTVVNSSAGHVLW